MRHVIILGMALVLAGAGTVKAADVSKSSGSTDLDFILEAARGGMSEVELGKLAAQQAQSDEVKRFGQKMADEHGRGVDELKSIAQNRNITFPSSLTSEAKGLESRLSKLHGPAFDRAYMKAMLSDHRKDIHAFKHESTTGRDAEVKAWATRALPMLEDHLKAAQAANASVTPAGSAH